MFFPLFSMKCDKCAHSITERCEAYLKRQMIDHLEERHDKDKELQNIEKKKRHM